MTKQNKTKNICFPSLLSFQLTFSMDRLEKFDLKVLDNIFLRLHFLQKKECMRVCRKWRDAIKDRTYFDTVTITDEGMLFDS
jgi:hypothetical protein